MNKKFANAIAAAQAAPRNDDVPVDDAVIAGNWTGHARRGMEEIVEKAKAEAARANDELFKGICDGVVPVAIPEMLIEDVIGTDRIASADDDDDGSSFKSLVANIKARGLRQPIRVRPIDPDWRPDPAFPRSVGSQRFALQSGRRRLAACRELGIEPLAFISFSSDDGSVDTKSDDLRERFFENAARKSLTVVENLYSIGLIYSEQGFSNQAEAAKELGVSQANISRGIAVVENFEALGSQIDLKTATRREIDDTLKDLRSKKPKHISTSYRQAAAEAGNAALPFKKQSIPLGVVKLKKTVKGTHVLSLESEDLDDSKIDKIMKLLKEI
jgi:ParB family transcriptional regulator, chromosome partitioning protein